MSKCYDNPDYDDLGSDIQNTWEQHKSEQYFKDIELPQQERQETLEEAAEKYNLNTINVFGDYQSFIDGAKWQMERSYSEEEVLKILNEFCDNFYENSIREDIIIKWFE